MSAGFVHLHVHSQHSLLDGAIRVSDLLAKCREYEMDAVALTDHGAMYGALEFYTKAKKAGVKPIVGCEFYVAPGHRSEKKTSEAGPAFHLILLAMNYEGYRNLMKLSSIAQFEGFYYKPRIDMEVLERYSDNLIALSACLHGEVPWLLSHNRPIEARDKALQMQRLFGDRYYFELQENGIPEQKVVNEGLIGLSRELGIKLLATNDCHYLNKEEAHAHEVLLCIQTGKTINDNDRFKFPSDDFYFKSPDEMRQLFSYCPEAVANTVEVAERCNLEIELGQHHFPRFPIPEGETLESMFTKACWQGLQERFAVMRQDKTLSPDVEKAYSERLKKEIDVINKMGFPGYFLIVADFINWAKDRDIPVGPGRGSGAGSLAAYCLRITDIDPLPYGLIFERFLNIERKSMPDFDVDFCQDRRGEVIDYVRSKYGGNAHVAQIITYGSMKARGVIRDVGRALDIPFGDVDKIAKLVPEQLKMTIAKAIDEEPKLKEAAARDPQIAELLNVSQTLEGLARHTSTHAAGVVVSPEPMVEYLPTCKGKEDETITQYDMKHTEMTGLIKFDFLGLKTLTVIQKALRHIKSDCGTDLDISTIPMDDLKTYKLLCAGDALGVFQLESSGMRELLVKLAPEQFSDLIALIALYRPGPLDSGMVDDFVNTKHGRQEAHYPLPQLKPILEETYGVIVYQEQVMKIANVLANYSLGDADTLRRAMGKKIAEVMDQEKEKFMAGARQNNIPEDKAEHIFDLMAKFAGYGFNKSHSAAYALIAYQTAYLKAHYPAQFMAALLSCDMANTDKVVLYINECREHQIDVLPPDINESVQDFSVRQDRIRFGLAAVKNVGESALASIIEEREKNGFYTSLVDFCNRVDSRRVNNRVIESLIKSGSFDSLGAKRSQLMAILPKAMDQAKAHQRDRLSGQLSLFSVGPQETTGDMNDIMLPDVAEWDERQKLIFEKDTVGFYITGHPLDDTLQEIRTVTDSDIANLDNFNEGQPVRVGGLIRSCKQLKSKRGDAMAFVTLEDILEAVEVMVFPETYGVCQHLLSTPDPVIIRGTVQKNERGVKIIAEEIDLLAEARVKYTEAVHARLRADSVTRIRLDELKQILFSYHGTCPFSITLYFPGEGEVDVEINRDFTVRPCRELSERVSALFGYDPLAFRKKALEAPVKRRGRTPA
ncbi:DNA polymerase III subunit alpha [Desulfofustis glycolicus]|uniref:DNA polymerase III subunit alpha n=1 Tax=Desulfofustis glycolicus DSM 9705 TaxID=1121409 RepID=A0A1M5W6G1_9BACT|nr:DNA polymerase III subunit alpha [Desulfofustis glycolicus]MCB2217263.1 DNA polymerase III subunit alpha [Desulfobulbaceae bacterium]SHH82773.1 DNA polymerase III, alpha subunit [Desulfofustis glycolicus DSM 9705]